MNKYKKLISNTVIFGIGTFSSKLLVFLLMPLYTRVLTNSDYGIVDLIVQTSNLLIPLVSMGITSAVIRFGLDKSSKKSDVFSTGLITIFIGFGLFLLLAPALRHVKYLSENTLFIYLYVLMSCLHALCAQFVRAKQMVKLYALDGIISTVNVVIFNVIFLLFFKLGVVGYVMSIIVSDMLSAVLLFIVADLHRYVHFKGIKRDTAVGMLKYSIPLIPTMVFWWVTNVSDRYLVTYMLGSNANGLYAVSYKIPTIVILISGIFIEAWQMSAVTEKDDPNRAKFFTKVFGAYQAVVFITVSGLIMFAKFITSILVSDAFYPSWRYIPLLVMTSTFTCFMTFLGSVYMVEKKSVMNLLTIVAGAVTNVGLNLIFIPMFGINGATFATFISSFLIFILRATNTRKYIKLDWDIKKFVFNMVILSAQSFVMLKEVQYWVIYEIVLFAVLFSFNIKPLFLSVKKLLH